MKDIENKFFALLLKAKRKKCYRNYCAQFKGYMSNLGINPNEKVEGEAAYIERWKLLDAPVDIYSYRLFSRFCGTSVDIVPEDISRSYIEEALNPSRYRHFYSDKNTYWMYIDKVFMPVTLLSRIGGDFIRDGEGNIVKEMDIPEGIDRVILKPSVDSCSGIGVMCFNRSGNSWVSKDGTSLTLDYLNNYGRDFILQEAVKQHGYISQFCDSAVNTFRIGVYRSVKDDSVNVVGTLMRIGKNGEFVDNAHAGGRFVGLDPLTGKMNHYVCDTYGNKYDIWNDIDFKNGDFTIPEWQKIIDFAKAIGASIPHLRLLALDICLDAAGNPKLIEFNVYGYSLWLFMFSGRTPFGGFTQEIIDYSKTVKPNTLEILPVLKRKK